MNIMPIDHTTPNRLVAILAYDGLCLFEFGIVHEIFGQDRPEMGADWYRCVVAAVDPPPLKAAGGLRITVDGGMEWLDQADTIVIPGWRGIDAPVPAHLTAALQQAHARGARLLSICSGVFTLAATGLLDGRRATTHWRYTEQLVGRYPAIRVQPDVLYIDEGSILTSAGSAAGIDLGLHLIRRDFGTQAANKVARRLVVPPHRDGGQAQFIERPVPRNHEGARLGTLLQRLQVDPGTQCSVDQMAADVGMSRRTFLRRFQETTGLPPGEWLVHQRLAKAQHLLETTPLLLEQVAEKAGFGSAATLRHHFQAKLNTSPSRYRDRFLGETK